MKIGNPKFSPWRLPQGSLLDWYRVQCTLSSQNNFVSKNHYRKKKGGQVSVSVTGPRRWSVEGDEWGGKGGYIYTPQKIPRASCNLTYRFLKLCKIKSFEYFNVLFSQSVLKDNTSNIMELKHNFWHVQKKIVGHFFNYKIRGKCVFWVLSQIAKEASKLRNSDTFITLTLM